MAGRIARAWKWLTGEAWVFDPVGAGARIPAIALSLAAGAATGRPLIGVLAAGGAYTVGFGAPLDLRGSKSLLLVAASFGIGASATLGSLAATHFSSAVVVVAAFGFLCGRAAPRGAGPAWIALQCGLAAIIASSYPASWQRAAVRALIILAGGLAQTGALAIARFARRRLPPPPPGEPLVPLYAVHLAVALAAATLLVRAIAIPHGYWAPMTALLVLRPDAKHTTTRALLRIGGTVGGAGLASAAILLVHPGAATLAFGVAVAAFGSYLFQKATYGLLSACVTIYVVFILSLAGVPEAEVATSRILATALGGAIALGVQAGGWLASRRRGTNGQAS